MLLTIDIGNSNITMGAYRGQTLLFVARLATDRKRTGDQYAVELRSTFLLNNVEPSGFSGAILSSVVPELSDALYHAAKRVTGCAPMVVGPGLKTGLNIRTDIPGQLGADLVAGAVAAIGLYPMPCLVMDLGTATKICVLDRTGTFVGCTISAGVRISLDALATCTSQLPHISLTSPSSAIGTNSVDCMRSGTVYGTAAMLDGLSDRIEQELGQPAATVVATGGMAKDIVCHCRRPVIYHETLLLDGLRFIYEKNAKHKEDSGRA